MKVDASELNKMVGIAVNGIGRKGTSALNTAITLLDDNGKLSLLTTTGVSTLKVSTDIDSSNFTSCSVENTLFVSLLAKLEGEIELSIEEGRYLYIKGKGEYKIPAIFDYNGNLALIPSIERVEEGLQDLDIEELNRAIGICKNACPEDLNVPILYNISFGTDVIATNDEKMICVPNVTKFNGLLSVHNLPIVTSVFKGDTKYKIDGKTLIMQDNYSTLVTVTDDSQGYPTHIVQGLTYDNTFEVEYEHIMNVIEKGKLFISPFDRNQIKLDIKTDGIVLRSNNNDFIEEVAFCSPNNVEELSDLKINLLDLYSILTSCTNGPITLSCTEDGPLVVKQNDYQGLISLYE